MHAQRLLLSILAAGIAVQALPAAAPLATVSLSETTNEVPAGTQPAILPREPKAEPKAETETGEKGEPEEKKAETQAGNADAKACNGTIAAGGQQAAPQNQEPSAQAGNAKAQGRPLLMPRDPSKRATAGGACANPNGTAASGTAAAGSARASGAAPAGNEGAEKKAAAEKAIKKKVAEKKAKAKAAAKKAKAAAEKKAEAANGGGN